MIASAFGTHSFTDMWISKWTNIDNLELFSYNQEKSKCFNYLILTQAAKPNLIRFWFLNIIKNSNGIELIVVFEIYEKS